MTGPEHYLAAERLLGEIQEHPSSSINKTESLMGQAQVHATLALAAATALNSDDRRWAEVAGTRLARLNPTRVMTMRDRARYRPRPARNVGYRTYRAMHERITQLLRRYYHRRQGQ
jgi:hypothetical protein